MNVKSTQYDAIFITDISTIGIRLDGCRLIKVDYLGRAKTTTKLGNKTMPPASKTAADVQNKIEQYLRPKSKIKHLDIAVQLDVSPFQEKVLQQLLLIPYGETRTYGEIAKTLKTSARAIGNACRHNPLPIIIPCHRVVAANSIGGYDGATEGVTLNIKVRLLQLEGNITQRVL